MKNLIILLVAIMFTLVGVASAGSGTVNDPYVVYYVGWSWDWGEYGNGTSMGNGSGYPVYAPNWTTYGNYTDVYTCDILAVASNKTPGSTVYYKHIYADLDTMNFSSSNGVPSHITNLVSTVGYDYLIVDMFYSNVMNVQNQDNIAFVSATNASSPHKASIFSLSYNNTSAAPATFEFRDNLANSPTPLTQFAQDLNRGLIASNATPFSASFPQYLVLLKDLN